MPVPLLGRAIRRRHSVVDEERGGRVVARHIFDLLSISIDCNVKITVILNPFDTFGSTALPIGTHLNYHWERCAPINTTLTSEHLVIQNGFVGQHMK